jgi:Tol biopolymer transport system component
MNQQKQSILIITISAILLMATSLGCGITAKLGPNPLITPSATVSSEGTLIFQSRRDGNYEIYRVQADGTGFTNLTNDPGDDKWAVWSPDGKQIAFNSDRSGLWGLYVMNADGSNPRRLYWLEETVWPAWSSDGRWIALSGDRIINANGSGERPVVAGNGEPCSQPAVWSPDGTQFACETSYGSGTAIAVRHVDLGQTTYLQVRRFNEVPAWSPDGTRIAFRTWDTGFAKSEYIYTANPDGSGLIKLTDNPTRSGAPVWSPDGTRVANIALKCTGILECGSFEIWVMNADGTGEIQLTYNDLAETELAWSPDGTRIAFAATGALYIINADGSTQRQLVAPGSGVSGPSWQPIAP